MKKLRNTLNMFSLAEDSKIRIDYIEIPKCESIALEGNIALDKGLRGSSLNVHLAHELGHCLTGAFYTRSSPLELREQKEYRANRWAVDTLLPESEIKKAVENGISTVYELAEYFDVTEDFVRLALEMRGDYESDKNAEWSVEGED